MEKIMEKIIFDSEIYENYILLSFMNLKTNKIRRFELKKAEDIFNKEDINNILTIIKNNWIITFNGYAYDLPLLHFALHKNLPSKIKELSNKIIQGLKVQKPYKSIKHIDLIKMVAKPKCSLKLYATRLNATHLQELQIPYDKVLTPEEISVVKDYNAYGLKITQKLYESLKEEIKVRYHLSKKYNFNYMEVTTATISESIINQLLLHQPINSSYEFYNKYTFQPFNNISFQSRKLTKLFNFYKKLTIDVKPNGVSLNNDYKNSKVTIKKKTYTLGLGGLHSEDLSGNIKSSKDIVIKELDVVSYYPMIIANNGLYPPRLGKGFVSVYKDLVKSRIDLIDNKDLITTSNALKLIINCCYGKMATPYSNLYCPSNILKISLGGQFYMLMLIEALELAGIEVDSANTDSLTCIIKNSKEEVFNSISNEWKSKLNFQLRVKQIKARYRLNINNYIDVYDDNSYKGKGFLLMRELIKINLVV